MNSYVNYFTMSHPYTYLWGRYRPAILKLMIDSATGPQEYKFSQHEVRRANQKEKAGFAFILKVHKGKAVNDIRLSSIAKDLLMVLQNSGNASKLSETSVYELRLDRHFVFHVVREERPQKTETGSQAITPKQVGE